MTTQGNIRRLAMALAVGAGCLSLLSGCLEKSEYITQRIGIALVKGGNNWNAAIVKYGVVEAASYTLPYDRKNAETDTVQQTQLQNMVDPKKNENPCKAVILTAINPDLTTINVITSENVPLILFETPIEGANYACLVTGDNVQAAQLAATFILDTLNDQAPRVLTLEAPQANYKTRMAAFRAQLGQPTIDSLVKEPTRTVGKAMMLSILEMENTPEIDAVYTADDDLALGVVDALKETGNTSIRVVAGCGGAQAWLNLIETTDDRILATALYSPAMIRTCVEIAYKLVILGEAPAQKEIHYPSALITRANLAEYLDPESYY